MELTDPVVFVVDDDLAVRQSLTKLIETAGFRVKDYASAEAFLGDYKPEQPGCLILDVRMPGMSGLELQDALHQRDASLPVVIVTGYAGVDMAVRAMKQGAMDFIEKPLDTHVLLNRIRVAVDQHLTHCQREAQLHGIRSDMSRLTPRERQVLRYVVDGRLNKEIASELKLSEKTVEIHRANLMRKMKATTAADLVRKALSVDPSFAEPVHH